MVAIARPRRRDRRYAGKLGGIATKKKMGKEFYRRIGRLGGLNKRKAKKLVFRSRKR